MMMMEESPEAHQEDLHLHILLLLRQQAESMKMNKQGRRDQELLLHQDAQHYVSMKLEVVEPIGVHDNLCESRRPE